MSLAIACAIGAVVGWFLRGWSDANGPTRHDALATIIAQDSVKRAARQLLSDEHKKRAERS